MPDKSFHRDVRERLTFEVSECLATASTRCAARVASLPRPDPRDGGPGPAGPGGRGPAAHLWQLHRRPDHGLNRPVRLLGHRPDNHGLTPTSLSIESELELNDCRMRPIRERRGPMKVTQIVWTCCVSTTIALGLLGSPSLVAEEVRIDLRSDFDWRLGEWRSEISVKREIPECVGFTGGKDVDFPCKEGPFSIIAVTLKARKPGTFDLIPELFLVCDGLQHRVCQGIRILEPKPDPRAAAFHPPCHALVWPGHAGDRISCKKGDSIVFELLFDHVWHGQGAELLVASRVAPLRQLASPAGEPSRCGNIPFDKFRSNTPLGGEVFLLVNTNSGRCLTEKDGVIVQGAFASSATSQERWRLVRHGDYYAIVNHKSGRLLTLPDASRNEGTSLTAARAAEGAGLHQQWHFDKVGKHYAIRSPASGLVVAVAEGSQAEGFRVLQWTWYKGPEQIWMVQWVPGDGGRSEPAVSRQPTTRR